MLGYLCNDVRLSTSWINVKLKRYRTIIYQIKELYSLKSIRLLNFQNNLKPSQSTARHGKKNH